MHTLSRRQSSTLILTHTLAPTEAPTFKCSFTQCTIMPGAAQNVRRRNHSPLPLLAPALPLLLPLALAVR